MPSLPAAVQTLAGRRASTLIHVCSPGPAGVAGALLARALGLPLVGSYHTELAAYAGLRSGEQRVADAMALAVSAFYGACDLVLSPSPAADDALAALGMPAERVLRWDRGVDTDALRSRRCATPAPLPGCVNVLYAGADHSARRASTCSPTRSCSRASASPRLHLVLAGGGPEQERLRERLGEHATLPRLARGRGARARLRERRHLPVPERDRHLRPGDPRGAGERRCRCRASPRAARGR